MARTHPTGTSLTHKDNGFRTAKRPTHDGADFRAPIGTPVKAAMSGTIKTGTGHKNAGTWIEIHDGNTIAGYSHLSAVAVRAGQRVREGQIIGYSGATGNVTGPHLHFYVKRGGKFIDPVAWLAESTTTSASATGGDSLPLRVGSAGLRVGRLQAGLNRVFPAYRNHVPLGRGKLLKKDNIYGPITEAWIKEFQKRVKLRVTGVVDQATADQLAAYGVRL